MIPASATAAAVAVAVATAAIAQAPCRNVPVRSVSTVNLWLALVNTRTKTADKGDLFPNLQTEDINQDWSDARTPEILQYCNIAQ